MDTPHSDRAYLLSSGPTASGASTAAHVRARTVRGVSLDAGVTVAAGDVIAGPLLAVRRSPG